MLDMNCAVGSEDRRAENRHAKRMVEAPTDRTAARPSMTDRGRFCGAVRAASTTSGTAAQRAYRTQCDAETTDFSRKIRSARQPEKWRTPIPRNLTEPCYY